MERVEDVGLGCTQVVATARGCGRSRLIMRSSGLVHLRARALERLLTHFLPEGKMGQVVSAFAGTVILVVWYVRECSRSLVHSFRDSVSGTAFHL